jgi:hypothetical protein
MKIRDVVEPHLRSLEEAATRLGKTTSDTWRQFRGRPGVVILRLPGRRRIVLIPESVFTEPTWTARQLAREFRIRLSAVHRIFRDVSGVILAGEPLGSELIVPESVRRQVFRRATVGQRRRSNG